MLLHAVLAAAQAQEQPYCGALLLVLVVLLLLLPQLHTASSGSHDP